MVIVLINYELVFDVYQVLYYLIKGESYGNINLVGNGNISWMDRK